MPYIAGYSDIRFFIIVSIRISKGMTAMKKAEKRQAEEFVKVLGQAHDEIRKSIEKADSVAAMELLEQCQDGAIQLGNLIEKTEGEGFVTVPLIEEYCELVYQIHERLASGEVAEGKPIYRKLRKSLIQVENSVKNDIKARLEIAFFPYKASMWDSLESVWRAADADPNCDAYVVPIPYYDRKPDRSFGEKHYEGNQYPMDVPVVWYEDYNLAERKPDIAYIHNPYDEYNYVTSVDPRYYSHEIKKYVRCLVYIPYYATSGGWGESKGFCSAYQHVDYIIVQAEKYRSFFDASIPKEKIIPLGSPKFDRVIRMCNNPPEPPEEWKPQMEGRKVYFYNTSIKNMLMDTKCFLEKMQQVFSCFRGRKDACLIWRPHPLLESTFTSMRAGYYSEYLRLKRQFIEEKFGIYDDTPDVNRTISYCDAYIGDSSSSVVSLFGIAGKALFILNHAINMEFQPEDRKSVVLKSLYLHDKMCKWIIGPGNTLYEYVDQDKCYHYICKLSKYAAMYYYNWTFEIGERVYVCPLHAQNILVVNQGKIEKTIPFKRQLECAWAFCGAVRVGASLFLLPQRYPSIVKYNSANGKLDYFDDFPQIFVQKCQGEWQIGGSCAWKDYLLLASPVDGRVLVVDNRSNRIQIITLTTRNTGGCMVMVPDGEEVWLLPYTGDVITRWKPETGELQDYSGLPESFHCNQRPHGHVCMLKPFSSALFDRDYIYLAPFWGNKYIRIDRNTGRMEEWHPPFPVAREEINGFFATNDKKAQLFSCTDGQGKRKNYCISFLDGKLYELSTEMEEYREIPISINEEDLKQHAPGFAEQSEWLQYACIEDTFNTLPDFLEGSITGARFDKERQLRDFQNITEDHNGTCGEKTHQFVREKL